MRIVKLFYFLIFFVFSVFDLNATDTGRASMVLDSPRKEKSTTHKSSEDAESKAEGETERKDTDAHIEVSFFNVGQGNSALVKCPGGGALLMDSGSSKMPDALKDGRELNSQQKKRLWTI